MTRNECTISARDFAHDGTQVLSRRVVKLATVTICVSALLTVTGRTCAGQTWYQSCSSPTSGPQPGPPWGPPLACCPPGPQAGSYSFASPSPAHFQLSPVASPRGGNCSIDVVSGDLGTIATSQGGFAFSTQNQEPPGAPPTTKYTITFDMQWVSGKNAWQFINESGGNGVYNSLKFTVPYPGDGCWHHYEYTGDLGPNGPRDTMYVYQNWLSAGQAGTPEEMRIANITMVRVAPTTRTTPSGPVVSKALGTCCAPRR